MIIFFALVETDRKWSLVKSYEFLGTVYEYSEALLEILTLAPDAYHNHFNLMKEP